MLCCINCFKDSHIRKIIQDNKEIGTCDFCSSTDVPVFNITSSNDISDCITGLVQIYKIADTPDAKYMIDSLIDDWNIFSLEKLNKNRIKDLINALCHYEQITVNILSDKVIIPQLRDKDFLSDYGVIRGLTWDEFSNHIKNINRFHSNFNSEAFASFLSALVRQYESGTHFYRARIAKDYTGFNADDMKSPPVGRRTAGRINPEGIAVLYLASDKETVLYEKRANMYDFVSIGDFVSKRILRVIDLSKLENLSPFLYNGGLEQFAINFKVFQAMSKDISKPLRRNDSPLDYLPTQFISEFIKSERYDGVEYKSTISRTGRNIALFDENLVTCLNVQTVEITDMNYTTSPIDC